MESSPVKTADVLDINIDNNQIIDQDSSNYMKKSGLFVEMLDEIHQGEHTKDRMQELSDNFLSVIGGQSLCIFTLDASGKDFLPRITSGEKRELLSSCFYSRKEVVNNEAFRSKSPVILTKKDNFSGDILLEEISKRIDFDTAMICPFGKCSHREGFVVILGNSGQKVYSSGDLKIIQAFTEIMGLLCRYSIVNTRLEEQSKEIDRKEFDLYSVYYVAKSLSSILDLEELATMLADMLTELLQVGHALVFLTDEDEETINIKSYKYFNLEKPISFESINMSEKSVEWLLQQTFEGNILTDFSEESFLLAFPEADKTLKKLDVEAVVPMIYKYKLIGFLALGKKYLGDKFTKRDFDFLTTIAPLAANAISNAKLYEMAILDGLTRIYLGRYFQQRCREEIRRAKRYKKTMSLIMWDIDHFKEVNDTYGHLVGDTVLKELAGLFKQSYRQGVDLIARYGGEEFVMLLPDTPLDGALIMAERLRRNVAKFPFANGLLNISMSGGISSFPDDGEDYIGLVEQADLQLYKAKRSGRNRICWKKNEERSEDA